MTTYLYRRGNGNDGNYPQLVVSLKSEQDQDPHFALKALVMSDYVLNSKSRKHIIDHAEFYGDYIQPYLCVHEGPEGETEFDADWLTAELQPISDKDLPFYKARYESYESLEDAVDEAAYGWFLEQPSA